MKLLILIVLTFASIGMYSQATPLSAGGDTGIGTGKVNYSIGQLDYTAFSGAGGNVNEGVQQAFEIFLSTGINFDEISLETIAFPNPVSDHLHLRIAENRNEYKDLSFSLLSIEGEIILTGTIFQRETLIPLGEFSRGIYLLKLNDKELSIKSFYIIKY